MFLESCKGMGNTIQELQHNATWNLGHTAWFVTNVYFTFVLFSSLIPKNAIRHCFHKIVEFQAKIIVERASFSIFVWTVTFMNLYSWI